MTPSVAKIYGPKVPTVLARIFGPPPLFKDEDPQLYADFFSDLVDEFGPRKTTEWLLVKDLADISWERLRERRIKPRVIAVISDWNTNGGNRSDYDRTRTLQLEERSTSLIPVYIEEPKAIDAFDRREANSLSRFLVIVRELERLKSTTSQNSVRPTAAVIDAEFKEASE